MKTYWDSSALLKAFFDVQVRAGLRPRADNFTRPHALAEVFSALTGGRLSIRHAPDDAAEMLTELAGDLVFVELSAEETLDALQRAKSRGVIGGRIHDFLHATAATKAGVQRLRTANASDFQGFEEGWTIAAP